MTAPQEPMTVRQEPNDAMPMPQVTPLPVQRPASRTSRFARPVIAVIVVAALAFAGGFEVANATNRSSSPTTANGQSGGGQFGGPDASPGAGRGRNGFGGGAAGTVTAVSAQQMTVTTANGAQRLVLLTSTTTVTEVTSTTKSLADIASGKTVTVIGTANPDGSVTATQVIIGTAGFLGRAPNAGASSAPSATP